MLGDDVDKWTQLLNEIRQGRKTFDTSEDRKSFGTIVINYGGVKQDVNNKYYQWHKEILNKFGNKLKGTMRSFYQEIQGARRKLRACQSTPQMMSPSSSPRFKKSSAVFKDGNFPSRDRRKDRNY